MKKFFILSLIATFVSVLSVSAQDNTYSMIIKMANGTTFTIGPNEVDSLWFNDGQVTVAGTNIMDLVNSIAQLKYESDNLKRDNESQRAWVIAMLAQYAKKEELQMCIDLIKMNSRQIRGDAQIVNPETGEPYTWQQYDWEQGKYVDQPVTMEMVVHKIQENYNELMARSDAIYYELMEHTKALENQLQKMQEVLEELQNTQK